MGAATLKARLYRVHAEFPGVVMSDQEDELLHGEVFDGVTREHLLSLDIYEGCDPMMPETERLYRRIEVEAQLVTGEIVPVYIWEYIREVDEQDRIWTGDWLSATS